MRSLGLVLVAAGVASGTWGCAQRAPLSNAYAQVNAAVGERCAFGALHADGKCDVYEVSLAELFVVPERFHGKRVRVAGYSTLTFEGNTLCEQPHDGSACLWLDVEHLGEPGFRRGWAVVEGVFNGENRGHFGGCAGTIEATNVKRSRR